MTSRLRQNAIGVAAVAAVLLLILLGTILWGIRNELFHNPSIPPISEILSEPTSESVNTNIREFVRPVKISPLALHQEDIIYGGDQGKGEVPLRHHSGHYRLRNAHVWDPHPIYEFTAFQRQFMLLLEQDTEFAPPELHVFHVWDNVSVNTGGSKRNHHGCFYKGRVDGDKNSLVTVNLCHGLTGHIRTSDGSYFIKPTEHSMNHSLPSLHVIYQESAGQSKCGLLDDIAPKRVTHNKDRGENDSSDTHSRRKRNAMNHEYFVELMISADRTMIEYHGEQSIENYILTLMHIVSGVFKDPSIGNPITISLVKMEILHGKSFTRRRNPRNGGVSAGELLENYCQYQKHNFKSGEPSFHHDAAVLLTRDNICRSVDEDQCGTLGLAELGTACDPHGSCSIVQDNGLSAAFTIAHELGHVLNVPHDGESFCKKYSHSPTHTHVMSNSHSQGTNPWSWSGCSRDIMTAYLESKDGECLRNRPRIDMLERWMREDIYPGEIIQADKQCDLLYGGGSKICPYKPVCRELWCTKPDATSGCQTLHMPWGDGTPCGSGQWCQKGECVRQNRDDLKKIDGQWGPWKEYGPCSRTCGGGIKKGFRNCNNPKPENGGRYCIGPSVRYKSCNTEDCGWDATDFRQMQCSKFDGNTLDIPGLPQNVRWIPKYGMEGDRRCVLYCRPYNTFNFFALQDKVIDGTPCSPDLYDVCSNGKCMPAGCDHILHSGMQLDICGKCGGLNDTCKLVRGHFNVSAKTDGYRTVVRIPAGSSNLDIRQGNGRGRDDNYLALIDPVTNAGLLNDAYILATTNMKHIRYEGTILEYSGTLSSVERINASRPLNRDLLVQVLSVAVLSPPEITYQYTVPKVNEDRYVWRHVEEWTPCDRVCNGQYSRVVACYVADTSDIINESYCSYHTKPASMVAVCNTDCDLSWRITGRSECSSHCGRGNRNLTKECVQVFHKSRRFSVHDNMYCSHLPNTPPDMEECEGPCDAAHWKYSQWSECSTTCGTGIQRRDAVCVDDLDRPKPPEKCDRNEMMVERPCVLERCPVLLYGNWSSCSVSCGTGLRRRDIWCQRNNQIVNIALCGPPSPAEESCEMSTCTKWSTSAWGPCSASCGAGYSKRTVTCTTEFGLPTNDADCRADPKPIALQECSKSCVFASHSAPTRIEQRSHIDWIVKDWSTCSAVCGGGLQTREVYCPARHGDSSRCRNPQPPRTRPCAEEPCPRWITQDWSPCSVSCGDGIKVRQVLCKSHDGNFLHDSHCEAMEGKPKQEMECQAPCNVRWRQGRWSTCSNSCGVGMKTRTVRCVHEPSGSRISDSHCMDIPKPKAKTKPCLRKACSFIWQESSWSECSVRCGPGMQSRNVTCHYINKHGWMDPESLESTDQCDQKKQPSQQQVCTTRDCRLRFYWIHDKWTQCSRPCGNEGVQRSRLSCKDISGRNVHNSRCRNQPRPGKKRRPCNVKPCNQYTNCKELQQHTNARTDGEYTLLVGGVNSTIYCKDMNTARPTEFLSLPYRNENYVWVSEDSSSKCEDQYPDASHKRELFTGFERIQLDVERLLIKTNDFSFTNRREGLTPYGEAGNSGCTDRSLCLHGLFSINLRGTSFAVSTRQKWQAREGTLLKIEKSDPQTLRGRCSGFCGYCYPSTRHTIKLHVLPP